MKYVIAVDCAESPNSGSMARGDRGCVAVWAYNFGGERLNGITIEKVRKHPFLLRLRIRLAIRRLVKRLEKIEKVKAKIKAEARVYVA